MTECTFLTRVVKNRYKFTDKSLQLLKKLVAFTLQLKTLKFCHKRFCFCYNPGFCFYVRIPLHCTRYTDGIHSVVSCHVAVDMRLSK